MEVGIHQAKTHLSRLIPAALAGEKVIISKSGRPLVQLVPVVEQGKKPRPLGCYAGQVTLSDDLTAPLPDELINDFWPAKDK